MFSLDRCRHILGRDCPLDDEQLTRLREQLYGLADVLTDRMQSQRQIPGNYKLEVKPNDYRAALSLLPESERQDVEERAAIIEFEGGADRDEAERKAILAAVQNRSPAK